MIKQELNRFDEDVKGLMARPTPQGSLMLYGSSFFTNWGYEAASKALSGAGMPVANHGFGGAILDDLLYHYGRLVQPYAPAMVVIRSGVNDLNVGYDAREAAFLLARLCEWIVADFPRCKVAILPAFDCPMPLIREDFMEHRDAFNRFCAEYAGTHPGYHLLDINSFFYKEESDVGSHTGFKDIFMPDGLHLTPEGYQEITPYLKGRLLEIWQG